MLDVLELVVEENQEQRQGREALLTVDDELLAVLVADDDRAEEVVAVVGHGATLIAFLVAVQELVGEAVEQLGDLLFLPAAAERASFIRSNTPASVQEYSKPREFEDCGDQGAGSLGLAVSFGRDVLPKLRGCKAREVTDVGRRDQHIWIIERHRLASENNVAVQRFVACCRLPLLPSLRPQDSRLPHGRSRQRQVLQQAGQCIEPFDPFRLFSAQQLATYFIVGDLGHDYTRTGGDQRLQPLGTGQALGRKLWIRDKSERSCIQQDSAAHQVTPLRKAGNRGRSESRSSSKARMRNSPVSFCS